MTYSTAKSITAQARPPLFKGPVKTRFFRVPATLLGPLLGLLVVALFTVNGFMHYPGTMNNDSLSQYSQAVSGRYTDWHPPVMAWLWSWLRLVADGPGPLLLLHLALYWLGFGLLADGLRRAGHLGLALIMALAGAFPPFLYINATVTKDVGLVASWLVAIGLLFWFRVQQRRIPVACALVIAALLAYGTLVRSNAVFAIGPLLLYAIGPISWLRSTRLIAAAVVVAVVAVPVTMQANRWLFNPSPLHPEQSLFLFDLMGIAVHEEQPGLLKPSVSLSASELQACYTPYWWDSLSSWGPCSANVHRTEGELVTAPEGLAQQWAHTILQHPAAYVVHRFKHFNSSLLFIVPLKHIRLTPEFRTDNSTHAPLEVITEQDMRLDLLRKNPLIWPVTWVAWGIGVLAFISRQNPVPTVQLAKVLIVSALGYSCAYLLIGVATDMRYHYWSLVAIFSASVLVLPMLAQGLRSRSALLLSAIGFTTVVISIGVAARLFDFRAFVLA